MKRGGNHSHLQMMAVLYAQNFAVEKMQMKKMGYHELSN